MAKFVKPCMRFLFQATKTSANDKHAPENASLLVTLCTLFFRRSLSKKALEISSYFIDQLCVAVRLRTRRIVIGLYRWTECFFKIYAMLLIAVRDQTSFK